MTIRLTTERLDWHVWNWSQWMERSANPLTWAKQASNGENFSSMDRVENPNDSRGYREYCIDAASQVQLVLDAMVPRLRLSVYVKHSISDESSLRAVYTFRGNVDDNYGEAMEILAVRLAARGLC